MITNMCPESVPRVSGTPCRHSRDTLGTLLDTPETGARKDTPSDNPVFGDTLGDTPRHSGSARDPCSWSAGPQFLGNVPETPTPTTCPKSTAVHLQFVRQYAPHLYRRAFLASKLRRKGNPAIRLPFVRHYAPHLYGSTFGKILGVGRPMITKPC